MRTARIRGEGGAGYYHCISRVVDRQFLRGEGPKEMFCKLMRQISMISTCRRVCGRSLCTGRVGRCRTFTRRDVSMKVPTAVKDIAPIGRKRPCSLDVLALYWLVVWIPLL